MNVCVNANANANASTNIESYELWMKNYVQIWYCAIRKSRKFQLTYLITFSGWMYYIVYDWFMSEIKHSLFFVALLSFAGMRENLICWLRIEQSKIYQWNIRRRRRRKAREKSNHRLNDQQLINWKFNMTLIVLNNHVSCNFCVC